MMYATARLCDAAARRSIRKYSSAASRLDCSQSPSLNLKDLARARIAQIETERGVSPALIDTFHREHNYLRISLTERCNLRCFYCMPAEGIQLSQKDHILTDDEVIRLARLFVQNGVTKIRLTGGEPTIRKGLPEIVRRLNDLRRYGLRSIGMTSNGLTLHRNLSQLIDNGLTHLNLSLDTLDPFKFEIMTRRMGHEAVLKTLDAALASKLQSVKLNVVVVKALNDSEIADFVEMTRTKALSVRFIEFMPFTGNQWDKAKMVPSSHLLSHLQQIHPNIIKVKDETNDTARSYRVLGYKGTFGFISSMSDHFCSTCNRMRLTADGQIKVCLFDAKEISLRDQMRQGVTDEELLKTIGLAVSGKKEKHAGMEEIDVTTNRPMILIGVRHLYHDLSRGRNASRIKVDPALRFRPVNISDKPFSRAIQHYYTIRKHYMSSSSIAGQKSIPQLSHFDHQTGRAQMVDVGSKSDTARTAQASGRIYVPEVAYKLITSKDGSDMDGPTGSTAKARKKGDVLGVAQLAGIMACKRTSELIPLCHPLPLSHIEVVLTPESDATITSDSGGQKYSVMCRATASCHGKTGVEMEALTAVSIALLTVWDMLKAVAGKEMKISDIIVDRKSGGRSGDFRRVP